MAIEVLGPAAARSIGLQRILLGHQLVDGLGRQGAHAPDQLVRGGLLEQGQGGETPVDIVAALAHIIGQVADLPFGKLALKADKGAHRPQGGDDQRGQTHADQEAAR